MIRYSPFVIKLSAADRTNLEQHARAYTAPYRVVARAKIVLLVAAGLKNTVIASRLDAPVQMVEVAQALLQEGPRWPGRSPVPWSAAGFVTCVMPVAMTSRLEPPSKSGSAYVSGGPFGEHPARAWTVIAGVVAVLGFIGFGASGHSNSSGNGTATTAGGGVSSDSGQPGPYNGQTSHEGGLAPPARPTVNEPLWSGPLRIGDPGPNFEKQPPTSYGGFAGATMYYGAPMSVQAGGPVYNPAFVFYVSGSLVVARWQKSTDPTYDQCQQQLATQALSSSEVDDVPYQDGEAWCFTTQNKTNIVFARVRDQDGRAVQADAIVWRNLAHN